MSEIDEFIYLLQATTEHCSQPAIKSEAELFLKRYAAREKFLSFAKQAGELPTGVMATRNPKRTRRK